MAVKNGTECQTIPPATMKVFHLYILIAGRREGKKRMESERGKRGREGEEDGRGGEMEEGKKGRKKGEREGGIKRGEREEKRRRK